MADTWGLQQPMGQQQGIIQRLTGMPGFWNGITGLGAGLLSQATAPGGSVGQGLGQGLQAFNQNMLVGKQQQMAEQQRQFQREMATRQDTRAEERLGMDRAEIEREEAALRAAAEQRAATAEQLGLPPALATDPIIEAAVKARFDSQKPSSDLGKLAADFQAGRITEADYRARVQKLNTQGQQAGSPLSKLLAERNALAPNDPNRAAYDAAIVKATQQAGTILTVGPDGEVSYSQGVPGGAAAQTTAGRNRLEQQKFAQSGLAEGLGRFETLIDQYGSEGALTPTVAGSRMNALSKSLQLQLKDLYELGAITGPDEAYLQALIPDAASLGSLVPGFQDRAKAQLDELKKSLDERMKAAENAFGGNASAKPQAPQSLTGSGIQRPQTLTPETVGIADIDDDAALDWD